MSRKMQLKVIGAGVLASVIFGVTSLAVAFDRWDVHTEYDQTIYLSAAFVVFMIAQAVMRIVRK